MAKDTTPRICEWEGGCSFPRCNCPYAPESGMMPDDMSATQMNDPIAATDQAVETIKGVARIHCAYYLKLIEGGMDYESAVTTLQTMMWVLASKTDDVFETEDDE